MTPPASLLDRLAPTAIRYIKLGEGGRWARLCFEQGELHFGHPDEPHDWGLRGDWKGAREALIARGRTPRAASNLVREMEAFYTLGEDCLWITFAEDHLWWAFARPEIIDLRVQPGEHGAVMRRVRGWSCQDRLGTPLRIDGLSTRLTQVAGYRQTICRVPDPEHLLRRINAEDEPAVQVAREAQEALVAAAAGLIARLHWRDFEVLVDLLVQRSGWQRVSRLGGTLKDADLIVEQPATGERALVQVKSKADQATLARYEAIVRAGGYARLFFICHSPTGRLVPEADGRVHLWSGLELARRVVAAGLFDWIIAHSE